MRNLIVAVMIASLAQVPAALANGAKPGSPSGYGEIVSFGAQEPHGNADGPGNVVGDVRSGTARASDERGDPPPLNWSTLKYVFWQTGGPDGQQATQA
jgi:hypothetical protein